MPEVLSEYRPFEPTRLNLAVNDFYSWHLENDFVGSLKQVLRAYVHESGLSIEVCAGLYNTSKRSLQRKLEEAGSCYCSVLEEVRFEAVSQLLLQDADMKVIDEARIAASGECSERLGALRDTNSWEPAIAL